MKSADQLMLSIGALLASEREKRGIPVEKAAKETRMRPQRIRDMESDDLSHFTNPSYARMFIIAYAKYLGIPMQTIHDHLPDRGESGSEDYQYITASAHELPSLRRDLVSRPIRRSLWMPILGFAALAVIALLAVLFSYIYVNGNRITKALDKPPTPDPTPIVVTKTIVIQEPRIDNLPAAQATPIDPVASPTMSINPPTPAVAAASAPPTFTEAASIAAPPKPTPIVITSEQPSTIQSAPPVAATPAEDADRAFLLGSSPDQKTPAAAPSPAR